MFIPESRVLLAILWSKLTWYQQTKKEFTFHGRMHLNAPPYLQFLLADLSRNLIIMTLQDLLLLQSRKPELSWGNDEGKYGYWFCPQDFFDYAQQAIFFHSMPYKIHLVHLARLLSRMNERNIGMYKVPIWMPPGLLIIYFDYGGFHLHLLVFPFIYQFNSRIVALVCSLFAND